MSAAPLTHHEILALAAPFSRSGRRVDLPATDRLARRLAFQPRAWPAEALAGAPPVTETITLQARDDDRWTLERTLAGPDGRRATLQATGRDPAVLRALADAVPPSAQLEWVDGGNGTGAWVAWHHRLPQDAPAPAEGTTPSLVLRAADAVLAGHALEMTVMAVRGVPADLTLSLPAEGGAALPHDALAVLGWGWSDLTRRAAGLQATRSLPRHEPRRSPGAQAAFRQACAHLLGVWAAAPAQFHDRHRRARWRVVARRLIPLGCASTLVAGVAIVPQMSLSPNSILRMLAFHAPPLMLMAFFCTQEMPKFGLPPWPRPLRDGAWAPPGVSPR